MGKVNDKLMELEDAGVVIWSSEINAYVATADKENPVPFDLSDYLFKLHQSDANEADAAALAATVEEAHDEEI